MQIIAHRGASAQAPENTMAAFSLAKRLGADSIELDARTCKSGEVIVFHDDALERLTGAAGRTNDATLARLRELRVRGEPVPTLAEVIESADRPPALVIELKTERWDDFSVAVQVARILRATRANLRGPVVCSSFNPLALLTLRKLAPEVPRALLAGADQARPLRNRWFAGPCAPRELHLEASLIDAKLCERERRRGRDVVAWTVNEPAEARRLRDCGVAGIITDVPDVVRAAVQPLRNQFR